MNYIVSSDFDKNEIVSSKMRIKSLKEALEIVNDGDTIYLVNEVYRGKFTLRQKNITIIGSDDSIITYDASHGEKIRPCDGGDGEKVYGTTGSATFTIKPEASGFKMYNVIVENSYKPTGLAGRSGNQAVAFKTEAESGHYEKCTFLGHQDTLYVDNNSNVFYDCIISGTVDFVFGKGDAIFDSCKLVVRSKDSTLSYICAPNTYVSNSYGYLFYKCKVITDPCNDIYLGRPWYDAGAKERVVPRALFYKCDLPTNVKLEFVKMRENNPDDFELLYFDCSQNEKLVSNTKDLRIIDFYNKIYNQRRY